MKTLVAVIYSLTFAAIGVGLLLEHRACAQLRQDNTVLLGRLGELTEKMAEDQELPGRTAPSSGDLRDDATPVGATPSADTELQRLRREIDGLLQQHQQAASVREDTRQIRAALESRKKEARAARKAASVSASQLEITKAEYWTEHTRMDVTDELADRIRGDSLKAIVGNNLKGDPEFGQVKHLTVEYKFGGVTRTNEFREGEVIALPGE